MQFGFTQYEFSLNDGDIQSAATTVDLLNRTAKIEVTMYVPSTGETERVTANYTLTEE